MKIQGNYTTYYFTYIYIRIASLKNDAILEEDIKD